MKIRLSLVVSLALTAPAAEHAFDVVVYGGRGGGAIAAVAGAKG